MQRHIIFADITMVESEGAVLFSEDEAGIVIRQLIRSGKYSYLGATDAQTPSGSEVIRHELVSKV